VDASSTATAPPTTSAESEHSRPRFRGRSHQLAFLVAVPVGVVLALHSHTVAGRVSAIVYAAAVVFMFGMSGLYNGVTWSPAVRLRLRRADHAGIYLLIAGSYTPIGLLILTGTWRVVVLAVVWSGAALAILLKVVWVHAPKWLAVAIAVSLGWIGVGVMPQVAARAGLAPCLLLLGGGVLFTMGGLVYGFRRPDPFPKVFGYHEVFHGFVIAAVALQYVGIAFYVLPGS